MGDVAIESEQREQLHDKGGCSTVVEPTSSGKRPLDPDSVVQRDVEQGAIPSQDSTGCSEGPERELWEEEFRPSSPIIGSRRSRSVSVGGRIESRESRDVSPVFDEPWCDQLFKSASAECKRRLKEFRREERDSGYECATVVVSGDVRDKFTGTKWSGTVAFHAGEPGDRGHSHIMFPSPGANKWRALRWIGQRLGLKRSPSAI